jgi:hypothetical protein
MASSPAGGRPVAATTVIPRRVSSVAAASAAGLTVPSRRMMVPSRSVTTAR